jgi:protein-S-isoprenylcysteine O-methyltransferase Ste14
MDRFWFINLLTVSAIGVDIFWKLTDPRPAKTRLKDWLKPKSLLLGIFALVYFVLNYLSGLYFPLPPSVFDDIFLVLGIIIFTLGVVLSVWAKITMGKVWGIPAEHNLSRQNKLITTGPFHYTRNPIYVGLVMILIGYGLALQSYFTFLAVIPIFYFSRFVTEEEKILEDIFKHEYLEYKKKVPRFF